MRVFLKVLNLLEDLVQLSLSIFLLSECLRYYEGALLVHKIGGTNSTGNCTVNTTPLALEVALDLLQAVESTHLLLGSLRGLGRFLCRGRCLRG